MTKQEVKDEFAPARAARRGQGARCAAAQMQAARARMMAAVPHADVVVTNPTHFAVALLYDGTRSRARGRRQGPGPVAAQIRRIAEENDVPIVADPPLARSLHASSRSAR